MGRRRKIKPQSEPFGIERELRAVVARYFDRVQKQAIQLARARLATTDAGEETDFRGQLAFFFPIAEAELVVHKVSAFGERQILKQLGLKAPAMTPQRVRRHARAIAASINKIAPQTAAAIAPVVAKAVRRGLRASEITAELERRLGIQRKKAERLATAQVIQTNSSIRRERFAKLGAKEYDWHTVQDGNQRKWHDRLHGTRQRYDAPPLGGGGGPKDHGHPGSADVCRCQDLPVFEDL